MLMPPAGRRGSTLVIWAEVAAAEPPVVFAAEPPVVLAAEPPVVLEPVWADFDPLMLWLSVVDPPEVAAADPDGEAVWLA